MEKRAVGAASVRPSGPSFASFPRILCAEGSSSVVECLFVGAGGGGGGGGGGGVCVCVSGNGQLEGQLQDDLFFEIADEVGILVLLGWSCCDAFQHWPAWTNETFTTAVESLRSQVWGVWGVCVSVTLDSVRFPPPPNTHTPPLPLLPPSPPSGPFVLVWLSPSPSPPPTRWPGIIPAPGLSHAPAAVWSD